MQQSRKTHCGIDIHTHTLKGNSNTKQVIWSFTITVISGRSDNPPKRANFRQRQRQSVPMEKYRNTEQTETLQTSISFCSPCNDKTMSGTSVAGLFSNLWSVRISLVESTIRGLKFETSWPLPRSCCIQSRRLTRTPWTLYPPPPPPLFPCPPLSFCCPKIPQQDLVQCLRPQPLRCPTRLQMASLASSPVGRWLKFFLPHPGCQMCAGEVSALLGLVQVGATRNNNLIPVNAVS